MDAHETTGIPGSPQLHQSDAFLQALKLEFPEFRIVAKEGNLLSQVIHLLLMAITLGGQREYITRYHTVIGDTLYVPASWQKLADLDRVILLRHERVHLRQRRRLGTLTMAFLYLIPFLPLGLAYGRARIEWEAYAETLKATQELKGREAVNAPELKREIIRRFTGPDYGWMWPFPGAINRWYEQEIETLNGQLSPGLKGQGQPRA